MDVDRFYLLVLQVDQLYPLKNAPKRGYAIILYIRSFILKKDSDICEQNVMYVIKMIGGHWLNDTLPWKLRDIVPATNI